MKEKFLALVSQIEDIRKTAHETHVKGFFESDFVIYDVPEFISWKQKVLLELQQIKVQDSFLENTIEIIGRFEGYTDEKLFNELAGALNAMADNIDYYYKEAALMTTEEKGKMVFISHSTKDKDYVFAFVELLETLGLQEDEIVCSSMPPYCIPLNNKVYEWLIDKFQNCELYVIYMLSHNYYESPASLNEMGAAWAMKQDWSAILLPGFDFGEIAGCIDPSQIGIKLDDSDTATLKYRLEELKETLTKEFGLRSMSSAIWERRRDAFLSKVVDIKSNQDVVSREVVEHELQNKVKNSNKISVDACVLLVYASEDPGGQIMQLASLGGSSISTKGIEFIRKNTPRELARWTSAIDELLRQGYIKLVGRRDKIYTITNSGYVFADRVKAEFNIDTNNDYEEYLAD